MHAWMNRQTRILGKAMSRLQKALFFLDFSTCLFCFSILYMYIKISKLDRCCCSYQDKYTTCVMFLLKKSYSLRIGAEQSGQMLNKA